jgi:hypothetical protein
VKKVYNTGSNASARKSLQHIENKRINGDQKKPRLASLAAAFWAPPPFLPCASALPAPRGFRPRECPLARSSKAALSPGLAGLVPVFLYNPFTAADEKIPLSLVSVKKKPQHLVFS